MKIKFIPRSEVKISKRSSSKFRPLIDALGKLVAGGDALEVSYANEKELSSMRNVVYTFNRENGQKIKSGKDVTNSKIFFYIDKK